MALKDNLQTKLTVCNIASKVSTNYNVPCWIVLFVKFFLDVSCNILCIKAKVLEKKSIERKRKLSSFVSTNSPMFSLSLIFHCFPIPFLYQIKISTKKKQSTSSLAYQKELTFSMLYFESAWEAQSTASCCMSSDMSAFLITAFLCSDMLVSR